MKKLITGLSILFCQIMANAQTDSTVSITLQARDVEFLAPRICFNQRYETLGDSIRAKFRRDTTLQGNAPVLLQNQSYEEVINLLYEVKYMSYMELPIAAQNRISAAIAAITNAKVVAASTDADTRVNDSYSNMRKIGRKYLLKQK